MRALVLAPSSPLPPLPQAGVHKAPQIRPAMCGCAGVRGGARRPRSRVELPPSQQLQTQHIPHPPACCGRRCAWWSAATSFSCSTSTRSAATMTTASGAGTPATTRCVALKREKDEQTRGGGGVQGPGNCKVRGVEAGIGRADPGGDPGNYKVRGVEAGKGRADPGGGGSDFLI
eukprot:359808-Chlamydomonas_euryale.AAC.4